MDAKEKTFSVYVCFSVTACKSSERRMDLWCKDGPFHNNVSNARCFGDLRARFDRGKSLPIKLWRCYYESALKSDFSGYNDTLKSSCYVIRHFQLQQVTKSCKNSTYNFSFSDIFVSFSLFCLFVCFCLFACFFVYFFVWLFFQSFS